jgi:hypothetical protein
MAEVQISFRAVFGDKHLSVLERAHRSGINVDVRIELEKGDAYAARFENGGEGRSCYPLPQRGNYTARYKYILGH